MTISHYLTDQSPIAETLYDYANRIEAIAIDLRAEDPTDRVERREEIARDVIARLVDTRTDLDRSRHIRNEYEPDPVDLALVPSCSMGFPKKVRHLLHAASVLREAADEHQYNWEADETGRTVWL